MVKTNRKDEIKGKLQNKTKIIPNSNIPSEIKVSQEVQMWRNEITLLRGRKFASLEEAITELATLADNKLGFQPTSESIKFISDLIKSDENFEREVRAILSIEE